MRQRSASVVESPAARSVPVVGLAEAGEPDLGDSDAVDGGVELAVAGAGQAHPASGVADQTGIGATPA